MDVVVGGGVKANYLTRDLGLLRELEQWQTEKRKDRQMDRQTNRMLKHFSSLLESVKNVLEGR